MMKKNKINLFLKNYYKLKYNKNHKVKIKILMKTNQEKKYLASEKFKRIKQKIIFKLLHKIKKKL